jgi:hypothetical protein
MKLLKLSILTLLFTASITSCVKQEYDAPPNANSIDPSKVVNSQISYLTESCLNLESNKARVLGDSTISGVVIGDDRSGNIYKQIFIQDTAGGGMVILLDRTNLYGDYPVGRKIFVKLNGLYLVNYRGLPEIAYYVDPATGSTSGIPSSLIGDFITKGSYPNTVTPKVVTISDLFSSPARYLNTLIKMEDMQFDAASSNVLYSNPSSSTNRTIKDCPFTGALTMYNSSYSTFQSGITPSGKGSITGIFTTYYTTPQFVLRDTLDVMFTGTRTCP